MSSFCQHPVQNHLPRVLYVDVCLHEHLEVGIGAARPVFQRTKGVCSKAWEQTLSFTVERISCSRQASGQDLFCKSETTGQCLQSYSTVHDEVSSLQSLPLLAGACVPLQPAASAEPQGEGPFFSLWYFSPSAGASPVVRKTSWHKIWAAQFVSLQDLGQAMMKQTCFISACWLLNGDAGPSCILWRGKCQGQQSISHSQDF